MKNRFAKKKRSFFALAKLYRRKLAILQFASAFTPTFAVCRRELQGLNMINFDDITGENRLESIIHTGRKILTIHTEYISWTFWIRKTKRIT